MFSPRRLPLLAAFIMLAGLFYSFAHGQGAADKGKSEGKGEKVRFDTVDGITLHGVFFAGAKRNSPTVLMLHALGEDSRKKAWMSLAEALNKEGFGVLTFDFRGHGQSTEISEPTVFWKIPRNQNSVKRAPKKDSLEFKDMKSDYYPVLVNDIAAAKAFLDNRNDTGGCNTASLVVLGAETGATLGSIWINSEWHRYRFEPGNPLMFIQPTINKVPEGKDIMAAIWLSATSKLGSRAISLSTLLDTAGRENATPMVFFYSDEDTSGKSVARASEKRFKGVRKDEKYRFTGAVPIKGGGKLTGEKLLQKSLGTDEAIVSYVKDVAEVKGNEWGEKEFRKTLYKWRIPGTNQYVPAKLPNEKMLVFDTYERFLPR